MYDEELSLQRGMDCVWLVCQVASVTADSVGVCNAVCLLCTTSIVGLHVRSKVHCPVG